MPTAILNSFTKTAGHKVKETSVSASITHNNLRLYHHSDGKTYEYVGNDASGNRIYRDTKRVR